MWGLAFTMLTTLAFYGQCFLPWNETRPDLARLSDVVIEQLPFVPLFKTVHVTHNSSIVIFLFRLFTLYSVTDWYLAAWLFTLCAHCRMWMMFVCPIRAHPLLFATEVDPRNKFSNPFVNDLFFSGHISTTVLFALIDVQWQAVYISVAVFLGVCMMLSRIHYTIDMLVAPFVTYGCYAFLTGPAAQFMVSFESEAV